MSTLLLITLLVSHHLGDFQWTTKDMITAKAAGKPLMPIVNHAAVHGTIIIIVLLAFGKPWLWAIALGLVELVTHFVIDLGKGLLTNKYPTLADKEKKPYWQLYGLDQLLHLLVIVGIWYVAAGL